jgi:hypothetical protein
LAFRSLTPARCSHFLDIGSAGEESGMNWRLILPIVANYILLAIIIRLLLSLFACSSSASNRAAREIVAGRTSAPMLYCTVLCCASLGIDMSGWRPLIKGYLA